MSDLYNENYTKYQSNRGSFRSFVRSFYMKRAASLAIGRTLDFGCGLGDLLSLLPSNSVGLEYNKISVEVVRQRGLNVQFYDGFADDWSLTSVDLDGPFETMVISHVLEHFDEPYIILEKLLSASKRLGIKRLLIIVPGIAGFAIDKTHAHFVTESELVSFFKVRKGCSISHKGYYPFPLRWISKYFAHNEFQLTVDISA